MTTTSSPENFFEPWTCNEDGDLCNALGTVVVDMYGSGIPEEDEERYQRRISACVNACAGVATEELEKIDALIAPVIANEIRSSLETSQPDPEEGGQRQRTGNREPGSAAEPPPRPLDAPSREPEQCATKFIEREWIKYRAEAVPRDALPIQVKGRQLAFYAGVASIIFGLVNRLGPGDDTTEADFALLDSIEQELKEFAAATGGGL